MTEAELVRIISAYFAIFSSEEQQRVSVAHDNIFHFCDEYRVIPGLLSGMKLAFQIGQRTAQHGSSVRGAIELRAGFLLSMLVRPLWPGIILGDRPLILAEHIDSKSLFRVQVRVSAGRVIDTDQHEHGIK